LVDKADTKVFLSDIISDKDKEKYNAKSDEKQQ
jgi:hypothetical protein